MHPNVRPPLPTRGGYPPSTVLSTPRPRPASATTHRPMAPSPVTPTTPCRPKCPLSASRVQTTTSANAAFRQRVIAPSTSVSTPRRPASASRVRATATTSKWTDTVDDDDDDDVDTVLFSSPRLVVTEADVHGLNVVPASRAESKPHHSGEPPSRVALAKAEQFLAAWQREEAGFRSPLLYAESTFVQAKAMAASDLPEPNAFLASVAFGALELVCQSLQQQHPFIAGVVDVVGDALFTNHNELRGMATGSTNRSLLYFQQGQYCFDQLHAHDERVRVLTSAVHKANAEATRLKERIQKQHVAQLFERVQARVKTAAASESSEGRSEDQASSAYHQLRRVLYSGDMRGAQLDLSDGDYAFEPSVDEVLLFFNSLPTAQATSMLSRLQTRAAELQLPQLGEHYAAAVDLLPETERRLFLKEYMQLVDAEELQHALQDRDDTGNQEKQWQTFLDEMKDVLNVDHLSMSAHLSEAFHSDEARIGAKVYEVVDLVQEVAAEVSIADDNKPFRVSKELAARLRPFVTSKKTIEKLRQLMTTTPELNLEDAKTCGCVCGQHRLVSIDAAEDLRQATTIEADNTQQQSQAKGDAEAEAELRKKKTSRRATSSRGKRKESVVARTSTRTSLTTVRLFPLQETCHTVSLVVQLQFSRDGNSSQASRRGATRRESQDSARQQPSFKALAKDYLVRKYGIKSIAIMHGLQLEKSLLHYAAVEGHPRCELFAWFIGGDKTRAHYRDLGYQFYLRIVRTVAATLLRKPVDALTYAELVTVWTEHLGDGDPRGAVALSSLSGSQCADVCAGVLPQWMKEHPILKAAVDRFKVTNEAITIEVFLKQQMLLWEGRFVTMLAQVEQTMLGALGPTPPADGLDLAHFRSATKACGIDLTSAQALEQFDILVVDEGVSVPLSKAALFVMESKYLRYN